MVLRRSATQGCSNGQALQRFSSDLALHFHKVRGLKRQIWRELINIAAAERKISWLLVPSKGHAQTNPRFSIFSDLRKLLRSNRRHYITVSEAELYFCWAVKWTSCPKLVEWPFNNKLPKTIELLSNVADKQSATTDEEKVNLVISCINIVKLHLWKCSLWDKTYTTTSMELQVFWDCT